MNAVKDKITGLFKSFYYKTFSKQESKKEEEPVFITLEEAKGDPALVNEIYNQLNNAFLSGGLKIEYVASIKFRGQQYHISGTHKEWATFYRMETYDKIENI